MLTLSIFLAGLAIAISAIALSIAIYHDLRDRDFRIRNQQQIGIAPLHSERPTLRLWEQPAPQQTHEIPVQPAELMRSAGPDIVVGQRPAATNSLTADDPPPRKAA